MPRPSGGGRPLAIHFRTLDIRWLRRNGYFGPGAYGTMRQSLNGQQQGEVAIARSGADHFRLEIAGREERVRLTYTPQHFGGDRAWFECPRCAGKCAVLYGPRFACRGCRRIAYQSQRESPRYRPVLRARKIRERLGGTANLLEAFPARPYGMHAATYDRMRAQALRFEICVAARFPPSLVSPRRP